MVLFLLIVALFANVLAPYDPLGIDTGRRMLRPTARTCWERTR